ncbi:MAG: glycosyltransferase family 4 protein [Actinobacteria bacterium]|nr:glycosyltransferase family 4 protein [Actinomycetota bacterium]
MPPQPRVVIVSPGLPPPPGGLQQLALDAHVGLAQHADVTTVGIAARPVGIDGVHTVSPGRTAPLRLTAAALKLVRANSPDVLLSVTWKVATPTQPFHKGASVIYALGAELVRPTGAMRRLRDRTLNGADAIVAISRYSAELVSTMTQTPVSVVSPGVVLPKHRAARARSHEGLRVVSVGALVPRKGHRRLLEAVAHARAQHADVRLTIVGEGPMRPELQHAITKLGLTDVAWLTGRLTAEERDRHYRSADAFALLGERQGDEFEGFGIVLLEAASYGLPIITTLTGGTADAVADDNALTVSSAEEAGDALVLLAEDPVRADALSEAGVAFAERCSVERRAEDLLAILRAVTR